MTDKELKRLEVRALQVKIHEENLKRYPKPIQWLIEGFISPNDARELMGFKRIEQEGKK